MKLKTNNSKLLFVAALVSISFTYPAYAADLATVSGTHQTNFSPWRMDSSLMTSATDPHPDTSVPETMTGTAADTQFGRNIPSGSSGVTFDAKTTSGVAGFQSVVDRMNSTASGTSRLNQLQTQINQNMAQAGYVFDNKFGISSTTDSAGNLIGQATGNFVQTRQDLVSGAVQTTTCVGTFTTEPVLDPVTGKQMFDSKGFALMNYTLTSGTATGQNAGCTTK